MNRGVRIARTCTLVALLLAVLHDPLCGQDLLDTRWVALESYAHPGFFIRHRSYAGELTTVKSRLDELDSSFRIVRGLAGAGTVSFESRNFPKHYLRHQHFRIRLQKSDGSALFRKDASFRRRHALASGLSHVPLDHDLVSYEAVNYPGYFLRSRGDPTSGKASEGLELLLEKLVRDRLVVIGLDTGPEARFRRDSSFRIRARGRGENLLTPR